MVIYPLNMVIVQFVMLVRYVYPNLLLVKTPIVGELSRERSPVVWCCDPVVFSGRFTSWQEQNVLKFASEVNEVNEPSVQYDQQPDGVWGGCVFSKLVTPQAIRLLVASSR